MKPSKKDLINFQNIDHNECLKLWLIICLHLSDHHPARTRNVDKGFSRELDLNTKFSIKITDIHKTEKKRIVSALVFLVMKTGKNIQSTCQNILSKGILYLLLKGGENKGSMFLSKI